MIPLTKDKIAVGTRVYRNVDQKIGTITRLPYNSVHIINVFDIRWDGFTHTSAYFVDDIEQFFSIWTVDDDIEYARKNIQESFGLLRKEKPCQVCQKKNDIGVTVCWSCGNQP